MMEQKDKKLVIAEQPPGQVDFHEAAIIDEQGNEIEITEEMVRKAIHELDDAAYPEVEKSDS